MVVEAGAVEAVVAQVENMMDKGQEKKESVEKDK